MKKEFILRIEYDLYEKLKKVADEENRSVNKQIEYIIKKYIEKKEKLDK